MVLFQGHLQPKGTSNYPQNKVAAVVQGISKFIPWHKQRSESWEKTKDQSMKERKVTTRYFWNGRKRRLESIKETWVFYRALSIYLLSSSGPVQTLAPEASSCFSWQPSVNKRLPQLSLPTCIPLTLLIVECYYTKKNHSKKRV